MTTETMMMITTRWTLTSAQQEGAASAFRLFAHFCVCRDGGNEDGEVNTKKRKLDFDADQSGAHSWLHGASEICCWLNAPDFSEAKRAKKKEQKEEKLKKKLAKPNAQLVHELLQHWENFRQRDVEKPKRIAVMDQVLQSCKGKIMSVRFLAATFRRLCRLLSHCFAPISLNQFIRLTFLAV